MTDTEIQIAMAEARGLFRIEPLRRTTRKGKIDPDGVVLQYCEEHHGGYTSYALVPPYHNDLNAVHEFESYAYGNLMDSDQWERYGKLLEMTHATATILTKWEIDYHEFATLCHISARRRCECLLEALAYTQP